MALSFWFFTGRGAVVSPVADLDDDGFGEGGFLDFVVTVGGFALDFAGLEGLVVFFWVFTGWVRLGYPLEKQTRFLKLILPSEIP